jgi:hypothetical protein
MPYIESEEKGKIREIMNSAEPVLDGITDKLISYEVKPEHYRWLLEQAEKVERKETEQKVIKTGTSSQACTNCGANVSSYYCSVCGQKLSY